MLPSAHRQPQAVTWDEAENWQGDKVCREEGIRQHVGRNQSEGGIWDIRNFWIPLERMTYNFNFIHIRTHRFHSHSYLKKKIKRQLFNTTSSSFVLWDNGHQLRCTTLPFPSGAAAHPPHLQQGKGRAEFIFNHPQPTLFPPSAFPLMCSVPQSPLPPLPPLQEASEGQERWPEGPCPGSCSRPCASGPSYPGFPLTRINLFESVCACTGNKHL